MAEFRRVNEIWLIIYIVIAFITTLAYWFVAKLWFSAKETDDGLICFPPYVVLIHGVILLVGTILLISFGVEKMPEHDSNCDTNSM